MMQCITCVHEIGQRISEVWRCSESVYAGSILVRILQEPYTISAPLYIGAVTSSSVGLRDTLHQRLNLLVVDHHVPCRHQYQEVKTLWYRGNDRTVPPKASPSTSETRLCLFLSIVVGSN